MVLQYTSAPVHIDPVHSTLLLLISPIYPRYVCVCVCVCVYVCVCECWILPGGVITATVHKFIVIQLLTFFVPFNLMEIHSCLGMSFLPLSL